VDPDPPAAVIDLHRGAVTIFSLLNKSLIYVIDAIYIDSKSRYFKLVISNYTIYLTKNVKNSSRFR